MTSSDADERLTALHEAGHGVCATAMGMDVKRLVLHAPGSRHDEAGRVELHDWSSERDADVERHLTFTLAGRAAEYRAVGRYSERGAADWEQAATFVAVLFNTTPSSPRVEELLNISQVHANSNMHNPAVWSWIERCARALTKQRTLTGRDITLLWEAR